MVRPRKTVLPLSLSKASVRFLDTLPPKQYRQVTRKIIMLMADPQPADAERLKGYEYSRVTVGSTASSSMCTRVCCGSSRSASATMMKCTGGYLDPDRFCAVSAVGSQPYETPPGLNPFASG